MGDSIIISSAGVPTGVGEVISMELKKGSFSFWGKGEISMTSSIGAGEDVAGKGGVVT